jgi:hypothetical protein
MPPPGQSFMGGSRPLHGRKHKTDMINLIVQLMGEEQRLSMESL